MRSDNSSEPTTPQPERFDEFTGGYDDVDHASAAKRINADLRAMDTTPRVGHTKWHAAQDSCGAWEVRDFSGMSVFRKSDGKTSAHLAAAAPDLLEALQMLAPAADAMLCTLNERGIDNEKAKRGCAAIAKAYAAIARATR